MRKPRTVDLPTQQEIDALRDSGNIEELRALNERLAKVANQRFKQAEKSGIKRSRALDRAKYYLSEVSEVSDGEKFSRSKKIDIDNLHEQLTEIRIFLADQTSTVSGEKRRRAEQSFKTMTSGKKPYIEIPSEIKIPASWTGTANEYFQDRFLAFLEDDYWKDIKKLLYSPDTNILAEAGEAIAGGASIKDLNKAFRDYLKGEVSIFEVWDNWTSVGKK